MIKKLLNILGIIKQLFNMKPEKEVVCQKKSNMENREIYQYDYCYPTLLYKDSIESSKEGCVHCGGCDDTEE